MFATFPKGLSQGFFLCSGQQLTVLSACDASFCRCNACVVFFGALNRLFGGIYQHNFNHRVAGLQGFFAWKVKLFLLNQYIFNFFDGTAHSRFADDIGQTNMKLSAIFSPTHQSQQ